MKFWQAITWAETDQLIEIARCAEELGFHGLMSGDHAVYPEVHRTALSLLRHGPAADAAH